MINVLDYSEKKRQFLKVRGRYCVYVIGPVEKEPCKIGYAFDLVQRFSGVQIGNWVDLTVHYALWTPGKPVALRIEQRCHEILTQAKKHIRGEWFKVPAEWGKKTIDTVAAELYPAVKFMNHEQMIGYLRGKPLDKRDHVPKDLTDFQKPIIVAANQ